jgi:hypothetical protein
MDLIIDSGKDIVLSHLLEYNSKRASSFNGSGISGIEYYNIDEGGSRVLAR